MNEEAAVAYLRGLFDAAYRGRMATVVGAPHLAHHGEDVLISQAVTDTPDPEGRICTYLRAAPVRDPDDWRDYSPASLLVLP